MCLFYLGFSNNSALKKQLTQLAEYLAYNEKVSGSSPLLFKLYNKRKNG